VPRLDFILTGRDQLSRVLDRAGDSADRLGRRLLVASINGDAAVRRFTNNATRNLSELDRDSDAGAKALEALKKSAISLAPAAIPAAASLAPIAAGAGAVAIASLAMGAALIPQISALSEASEAQTKYEDAVAKSGARSEEATKAHAEYLRTVSALPPATREAAAAVGILKDDFADWSDSLSGDTMAPFIKGVAIANSLLPKTQDLVKGTAAEADRFMTIVGGEMASPGLDRLNTKFTAFSQRTLRQLNDEFVHLLRISDSGQIGAGAAEFMDWARAQGPAVGAVLRDVAQALIHVLDAGADMGVSMLQVVGVLASIVAAVPASALSALLQLAIALKLVKLAAAGMAAGRAAMVGFAAQIIAMNTASAAAPGRLAAVRAGIGALSKTAKVAAAGTGIGLLLVAISALDSAGDKAPDVDRLTTSLGTLGRTGKVTGEAAKAFGEDLGGLAESLRTLARPSTTQSVIQGLTSILGMDSTETKKAKENLDAVDKSLANLVSGGKADLAAAAYQRVEAAMRKQGMSASELKAQMGDYQSALADQKFEAQLAAESMGLFGAQAQKTQAALAAQKQSADGLRQSLQALNDTQRAGLGSMIAFESSVDAAAKSARENAGALSMSNGELNLGSEKARNAATSLQDLATKTDEATSAARESGSSWETVQGIYDKGRATFMRSAQAMGLTRSEAAQLASQIMRVPDKTARVNLRTEDAVANLDSVIRKIRSAPNAKSVTVKALTKDAVRLLESLGYKVTHLENGQFKVTAKTGSALSGIGALQRARDRLQSKSITFTTTKLTIFKTAQAGGANNQGAKNFAETSRWRGGILTRAGGGPITGSGTGVSDSIPLYGSAGEFVVNALSTRKHRGLIEAINDDRVPHSLTAGVGMDVGRGLAAGMSGSHSTVTAGARSTAAAIIAAMKAELEIASPSKKTTALAKDVGAGLIKGLTGSKAKIAATSKDLAKDIWAAFTGSKDNKLVAWVNKQTKTLTGLAGKRDTLIATIKNAKAFASTTKTGAIQSAGLGTLFEGEETVTATGISAKIQARLAKMKTFTSYINTLAKKGLNKTMLREILNMGPEEGYAYASALAGSNSTLLKQINSAQAGINSQASKLGNAGADALYDSGKNAGKGFLKGLTSQQAAIEKQMLKIAKGMDKAIRKALGIKSPSTVMAEVGRYSTEGLAAGLTQRTPVLDRALSDISARVAATRPVLGRPAVGVGAGGGTSITVNIGNAMDPVAVGRELQKVLVKYGRAQGATVSLKVGP
jgi:hypothetical protein